MQTPSIPRSICTTRRQLIAVLAACLLVALTQAPAATLYVDAASTNAVPPFADWATAAVTIQDAVDAAVAGDEIMVTNGVYQTGARAVYGMSNRVAVTKPVTVRSVNGPAYTSIVGHGTIGENAIRCMYLTNGAVLVGFTLTNGATQNYGNLLKNQAGGGMWCEGRSAIVSNCVLTGNAADSGGGVFGGTLSSCVLAGNLAGDAGGAAFFATLNNCALIGNSASAGGGAYCATLNNCTLVGNWGTDGGGASASTLNNCILTNNLGTWGGGAENSALNNCILIHNSAEYGGGANSATLSNCTLTGNSATLAGGGACWSTLTNCIVYYNSTAETGENYAACGLNYSCTTPMPESGVGNITQAPLFVDTNGWSNLRLQSNSPCINSGNNAYVTTSTDLDGRPRVVGGTVDIGAYEWQGTIRYVSAASTNPIAPYSSWATAAVTIQDAVDAAVAGDEIVVTNGVYQTGARAVYGMSNRVAVTKPVTVRSVNGPEVTMIQGAQGPFGSDMPVRCVYLTNGAALLGFTLTNGFTQAEVESYTNECGGGAWCEGLDAVLSNCVIVSCFAYVDGGGVFRGTLNNCTLTRNGSINGGGACNSTLSDCTFTRNFADDGGGASQSTLKNCTVADNGAVNGGGAARCVLSNCTLTGNSAYLGGGAYQSTFYNCTLAGNSTEWQGGGTWDCTLNNCTLTGNTAYLGGGVFLSTLTNCTLTSNSVSDINGIYPRGGGAYESTLVNCSLTRNTADEGGGACLSTLINCLLTGNAAIAGGGTVYSTLNNCTVVGNSASGGEVGGGGTAGSTLNNCIVYNNSARGEGENHYGGAINYSCTTPDPGGVGNITNAPLFVDTNGWSNLRLQSNSPCINGGNNAYVTAATDLDGLPRIAGGTVDIGAYEFQSPASTISYAWLQQFGLPIDGSADHADTDHDAHDNWQEWMAGTDPTNALSALRLAAPLLTPTNVILTWTSVPDRTYTVGRATNLGGAPAFSVLRSNLVGLPGTTSWTDSNAPVTSPRLYRLEVSQ